jgi:hypothetical protein
MQSVFKTTLDPAFAIDYVQEELAAGEWFGLALSKKPLDRGHVWTWLPPGVVLDSREGLLNDHGEVSYRSCREKLYGFVAAFLRDNQQGLFVAEGQTTSRVGRPPDVTHMFHGRIFVNEPSPYVIVRHPDTYKFWGLDTAPPPEKGIASFLWLDGTFVDYVDHSEKESIENIESTFRAARKYPSISCLTGTEMTLPREKVSPISSEEVRRLADAAEHIIVGAFDECGVVIWTDKHSPSSRS